MTTALGLAQSTRQTRLLQRPVLHATTTTHHPNALARTNAIHTSPRYVDKPAPPHEELSDSLTKVSTRPIGEHDYDDTAGTEHVVVVMSVADDDVTVFEDVHVYAW